MPLPLLGYLAILKNIAGKTTATLNERTSLKLGKFGKVWRQ